MDLENMDRDQTSFFQVVDQSMYSKNWEKEVIMKIARKLATLPCDIELMFGIFTQGSRNVTKVNFKHTVLHRLNLIKQGMTERELDLIFTSNEYLRKSDIIERDDFVEIFGPSILQAKRERQDQIAREGSIHRQTSMSVIQGYETGTIHQSSRSHMTGGA